MTQIDSTAQTDLGISDHEELLLPYKAIYSQLLDTIKEVVTQTLDSAYGTNAPHITTEVLEIALKDNLHSLVMSPDKSPEKIPLPVLEKKVFDTKPDVVDPKVLKMLQPNGLQPHENIFNQTTNQLLRLIELNSINSEIQKQQIKPFNPFIPYPGLSLQKMNAYSLLNQPSLFQNKPQHNSFQPTKTLQSTLPVSSAPHISPPNPIISVLQKPFGLPTDISNPQQQPKIFSPGVIKSEDTKLSPTRSPVQAFSTSVTQHDTKHIFSTSSPFTTPSAPLSKASAMLMASALPPTCLTSVGLTQPPLMSMANPALNLPVTSTTMSSMQVHQNFIKQMNLLNQAAPSMVGQKLMRIPGQELAPAGDIEKVLMDIQVNLTNIKPDPWNTAKDKLYKCPHCETAFARRQYLSNHIINVHNLKTCPECKTTFSNEDAFNSHLAMHPKKEYECGSCNKSFNSVYLLKNHRKTHVKDKPFACNICGKTFADKYYLRNHFSIHSPVKPYTCPVCGRGFASSSALRYHSFQHTGEKPAKCQYCPSEFVQKNQLKLHIARKHKELINTINGRLHEHNADVIPGNISLHGSPGSSPARTSPNTKNTSPFDIQTISIVHSPSSNGMILAGHKPPMPVVTEPMQVDSQKPAPPVETPTVAAANEQLQELIASLQRTTKQTDSLVDGLSAENKTIYNGGAANGFTLSSPFSKITDGINQILEGSPLAVNETS